MAKNISNGKSLSENIKSIMDAKVSDRTKKRSLIKLGLRQHEVEFIFAQAKVQVGEFDFSRLTFGVEIEAYGFTRQSLINAATANGLEVRSEDYNHQDHTTRYKIVRDGSLYGENCQEIVSPVLNGTNGLESLRTLCDALASVEAKVNRSCGLHVHIGTQGMTDQHYIRIFKNYQAIETAIDTFMPESRRGNNSRWCRTLTDHDFTHCTTKRDVQAALGFDRYHRVNAESYSRHQTVEFRQHSGTVDFTKIENWVKFLGKLVEYSYKHECPVCHTIEEIPFLTDTEKQFFISRRTALN